MKSALSIKHPHNSLIQIPSDDCNKNQPGIQIVLYEYLVRSMGRLSRYSDEFPEKNWKQPMGRNETWQVGHEKTPTSDSVSKNETEWILYYPKTIFP